MVKQLKPFVIITIAFVFCAVLIRSTATQSVQNERAILLSARASTIQSRESEISVESKSALINELVDEHVAQITESTLLDESPAIDLLMPQIPQIERVAQERPPEYYEIWAQVTAYCPCTRCCGRGSPGITSTGTSAWIKGVAADPRALPYGTKVEIPGYGVQIVDDTGGAMRRSWRGGRLHLDIRMTYHWQARQWGKKLLKIKVYK